MKVKVKLNQMWHSIKLDKLRSQMAIVMFLCGRKSQLSKFIDEETITAGYGQLYAVGSFEYGLPVKYVKKITGGHVLWKDLILSRRENGNN